MSATPEAKVKKMVKAVLEEFSEKICVVGEPPTIIVTTLYQYWPVPSGFGASSLDCIVCYYGVAIFIETKAPGKLPTPRQLYTIAEIQGAEGLVFVIDGVEGCGALRSALELIRFSHGGRNDGSKNVSSNS